MDNDDHVPLLETDVAAVWSDVIGTGNVDRNTNFFDLGGHSLMLTELVDKLAERLGVETDIVTVLEFPTVSAFVAHWNGAGSLRDA